MHQPVDEALIKSGAEGAFFFPFQVKKLSRLHALDPRQVKIFMNPLVALIAKMRFFRFSPRPS
jgi:hypothetical protein